MLLFFLYFRNSTNHGKFYRPPKSCHDLNRLGYTLNGFYLVKDKVADDSNMKSIDIVDCAYRTRLSVENKGIIEAIRHIYA